MICYLASPIDAAGSNAGLRVARENARQILVTHGVSVFDPSTAWHVSGDIVAGMSNYTARALQEVNWSAVDQCDFVLALSPSDVPSVGVPVEVYAALRESGRRVALWAGSKPGVMWRGLAERFPEKLRLIPDVGTDTLGDIVVWAKGDA